MSHDDIMRQIAFKVDGSIDKTSKKPYAGYIVCTLIIIIALASAMRAIYLWLHQH